MVTICFGLNYSFQPQMILFHFAVFQITAKRRSCQLHTITKPARHHIC